MKQKRQLILASRSPARWKLLKDAGFKLKRSFADIDESRVRGESINHYALRLAFAKAEKVSKRFPNDIIIGVDTVIIFRGKIFGKPNSKKNASRVLRTLSGKWHEVHSGTVILDAKNERVIKKLIISRVKFAELDRKMIEWYISTGEPMRAAGGYSIQNKGAQLVERVDGCYSNVVGISMSFVIAALKKLKAL